MDDFADIAKRMKELQLERDKPFDQPLQPDFHAELNAKLLGDKTAQANARWRELVANAKWRELSELAQRIAEWRKVSEQYNQSELEKLHGCW